MNRQFSDQHPEKMDLPQPASRLEQPLRDLASINRFFGGHWLVCRFLKAWFAPGQRYRVLDLATGAGDVPRLMVNWGRQRGIDIQVDALDANPVIVEIAQKMTPHREITYVQGDARTYDPGHTYDLVCSSLALHHFSEEDAVQVLRQSRRLSHRFTMIADLERGWGTTAGIWLLTALLFRDPITRDDGRTSAQRAFSFAELERLACEAGWADFEHSRFPLCRQAIWMASRDAGDIPVPVLEETAPLPCPT
jgi:hypothetical protein